MASFLDGLLGPALTVGTQAAGAQQGAEVEVGQDRRASMMQQLALMQKQQEEADQKRLREAQISNYESQTSHRGEPTSQYKQDAKGNWWKFDGNKATPVTAAEASAEPTTTPDTSGVVGSNAPSPATQAPKPASQITGKTTRDTGSDRTKAQFTVNGKPFVGSMDKQGNYYDTAGTRQPNAQPFVAPQTPVVIQGPGGENTYTRS